MPYIINEKTNAIIPKGKKSHIIEMTSNFVVSEKTSEIITRNCYIHGSSLEGRQKGSSYLIGSNYKPPIILNDATKLILIPTHSIRNTKCAWITLNNILNYYPHPNKKVLIEFKNNQKITLNITYSIFDHQVLRATRLESALRGRNNKKYL